MEIIENWETKGGSPVILTARLEQAEVKSGGHTFHGNFEIFMNVEVKGQSMGGCVRMLNEQERAQYPEFIAKVGKLALTAEQVEIIEGARKRLTNTPEWIAKQARITRNQQGLEQMEKLESGPCRHCGTYCYGDCGGIK